MKTEIKTIQAHRSCETGYQITINGIQGIMDTGTMDDLFFHLMIDGHPLREDRSWKGNCPCSNLINAFDEGYYSSSTLTVDEDCQPYTVDIETKEEYLQGLIDNEIENAQKITDEVYNF